MGITITDAELLKDIEDYKKNNPNKDLSSELKDRIAKHLGVGKSS